jgi:hypothetical protein
LTSTGAKMNNNHADTDSGSAPKDKAGADAHGPEDPGKVVDKDGTVGGSHGEDGLKSNDDGVSEDARTGKYENDWSSASEESSGEEEANDTASKNGKSLVGKTKVNGSDSDFEGSASGSAKDEAAVVTDGGLTWKVKVPKPTPRACYTDNVSAVPSTNEEWQKAIDHLTSKRASINMPDSKSKLKVSSPEVVTFARILPDGAVKDGISRMIYSRETEFKESQFDERLNLYESNAKAEFLNYSAKFGLVQREDFFDAHLAPSLDRHLDGFKETQFSGFKRKLAAALDLPEPAEDKKETVSTDDEA